MLAALLLLSRPIWATGFMDTPLKASYEALAQQQASLSWQALILALQKTPIEEAHWHSLKEAILSASQCGRTLEPENSAFDTTKRQVTLSLQRRTNLAQQGYQVKVSLEGASQAVNITLMDRDGKLWLEGRTELPQDGYVELESAEFLTPLAAGLYRLVIDSQSYWLVLSSPSQEDWLSLVEDRRLLLTVKRPPTLPSCLPPVALWRWFTEDYQLLGRAQSVRFTANSSTKQAQIEMPKSAPEKAQWLSTMVFKQHFQGAIQVEELQRLTLPIEYFIVTN